MEGNNMIRIVMLAAGMLVIGVAAATAQEKDCFSVTSPAQATMGSILINRCTGATWVLSRAITNSGTNHFIERFSYVVLHVVRLNSALTLGIGNPHLRQRKSAAGVGTSYSC
jgi:hypothetical protein